MAGVGSGGCGGKELRGGAVRCRYAVGFEAEVQSQRDKTSRIAECYDSLWDGFDEGVGAEFGEDGEIGDNGIYFYVDIGL